VQGTGEGKGGGERGQKKTGLVCRRTFFGAGDDLFLVLEGEGGEIWRDFLKRAGNGGKGGGVENSHIDVLWRGQLH